MWIIPLILQTVQIFRKHWLATNNLRLSFINTYQRIAWSTSCKIVSQKLKRSTEFDDEELRSTLSELFEALSIRLDGINRLDFENLFGVIAVIQQYDEILSKPSKRDALLYGKYILKSLVYRPENKEEETN